MAFIGLRLSDRTTQMLDEMAESTGLTRQEVLRVAIAVLYRVYNGQPVGAETQPASKFETAPQDAVRSQQEAQGDEEEELDDPGPFWKDGAM
jgi:hypothetical protein